MADQTSASIDIAASPAEIMKVIADFERYPEWVDSMKSAEVLTTAGAQAETVRMVLDHSLVKDDYVLAYDWQSDHGQLAPGRGHVAQGDGRFVRALAQGHRHHRDLYASAWT